jgi:glyoxylate utilization-related uncharacterized protein
LKNAKSVEIQVNKNNQIIHCEPFHQYVYALTNHIEINIEGKRIKLNSGDTLYIKPFAEYRITKKNSKILAMKIIGKINKEVIDELKSISSKNIKKIILEKNQWFKK